MTGSPPLLPPRWIAEESSLIEAAAAWQAAPRLGLDTESNGFHAYRPRICLIQLAWESPEGVCCDLIDVLALDGRLAPLAARLDDPEQELILHGAENDVRLLHRDLAMTVRSLVDTQTCARLLGLARTGLVPLAKELGGVEMSKSGQRLDWAHRPLPRKAIEYAALDAQVLFTLRDELGARLVESGRWRWAEEEFRALEALRYEEKAAPSLQAIAGRIGGAAALPPAQKKVLLSLVEWREEQARRRDVPAMKVLQPRAVLELARRRPRELGELRRAGLADSVVARDGKAILDRIARPRFRPSPKAPPAPAAGAQPTAAPGLLAELKRVRRSVARRLGLEEGVLCPNSLLLLAARHRAATEERLLQLGFRRWQVEQIGAAIIELTAAG